MSRLVGSLHCPLSPRLSDKLPTSASVAAVRRCQTTDVVVVFGKLPQEGQANTADRAVTLLTDNDFRSAFIRRIGIVDFVTVNEQNDVGILLDSAGFTQVGHDGTFVR